MAFRITDTFLRGLSQAFGRDGLVFVGLLFLLSMISFVLTPTPVLQPDGSVQQIAYFETSPQVWTAIQGGTSITGIMIWIAAIRTFVRDESTPTQSDYFTKSDILVIVNLVIGLIGFSLLVGVGLLLLIVPGIFVLVSLWLFSVYVIVEKQNFVRSYISSWRATRGRRLRLFGLGVLIVLSVTITLVTVWFISIVLDELIGSVLVGRSLMRFTYAAATVFVYAASAEAYLELRDHNAMDTSPETAQTAKPSETGHSVAEELRLMRESYGKQSEVELTSGGGDESESKRKLELLRQAREKGVLTDEEFEQKKQQLE